jgi:light-regulated signal transduction histidine kinase (bacteriophytochrome)
MSELARAATEEMVSSYAGPAPRIEIGDLPSCVGDATVMRQVWCNLIGNALKYSAGREQPLVAISGRVEELQAIYRVQDNGAGFDMNYADKLFGVFQRLHGQDEFAGTGVGLAIVHRIVVRHGGRIWANSTPGSGACFEFALPMAAESPQSTYEYTTEAHRR